MNIQTANSARKKEMARQTLATIHRNGEIAALCKSGMTLEEVGKSYGITRERVRQIVAKLGIPMESRGRAIRSFLSTKDKVDLAKAKEARSEAICQRRWGMTLDQYKDHVAVFGNTTKDGSPMRAYLTQRSNANHRGIEWRFTFAQWWDVWQESGKWSLRGRWTGYVMARHGDSGHYGIDNVYICTQGQNASDSFITKPASIRFAESSRRGKGKGYYYNPKRSKTNPFLVQFRNKHVGNFKTAEEARNAYLQAAAGFFVDTSKDTLSRPKKLNQDMVRLIRSDGRTCREIAKDFGVNHATVWNIKNFKIWKSVD